MVKILYAEYDATHKNDFVFDIPGGHEGWLLILTHTPAIFRVGDRYELMPPNTMVLYRPFQSIYYRACEQRYGNDWIRFITDEVYVTDTPIQCGVPFVPQHNLYLHKVFQLLTLEHERGGELSDMIVDRLLQVMFYKIVESYSDKPKNPLIKNVHELRNAIYAQPDEKWTVRLMAEKLNVSTSHLESIYKNAFGISCMEDVINGRIALAKKYLKDSHYNISEIIPLCGYSSSEHFFRQFKKMTGMTPKEYRASRTQRSPLESE